MCCSRAVNPPAQPAFILRGHSAQLHAVHFTPRNRRLLTGDADGWVISWNLSFKRPVAVWKAHAKTLLGLGSWAEDRVITHGRDNKLIVWNVGEDEEKGLDITLPVDNPMAGNKNPWILHCLTVNALNFCSFAMCDDMMLQPENTVLLASGKAPRPILVAVPNNVDSNGIDVYQLPSERRVAQIQASREITTGMVMSLGIRTQGCRIRVAAGYESGHTAVFVQNDPGDCFQLLYAHRAHTQPVLSLVIASSDDHYLTTSADDAISKHPFPERHGIWSTAPTPLKVLRTKHAGQQGASVRSDDKIFATAGWDSKVRVYSCKTMKELAVLKWHRQGCYATAFAHIMTDQESPPRLLSASTDPNAIKEDESDVEERKCSEQSSTTRSEKPILADDAKPSAQVLTQSSATQVIPKPPISSAGGITQRRRDEKAQGTHWLAVGSKDGKVSLWDIY